MHVYYVEYFWYLDLLDLNFVVDPYEMLLLVEQTHIAIEYNYHRKLSISVIVFMFKSLTTGFIYKCFKKK